jgi:Peptidase family M1 domain
LKRTILLFLTSFFLFTAHSQSAYWQQQVNYSIDVSLNDKLHILDGFESIEYINHSPDTLHFIWFHLWPNAYKNDKTAFSDQLLENGSTAFYFSDKEDKGYINRLDFKVNSITASLQDHPQHIDIAKLILPSPLAPGEKIIISTPFHVQLPYNFSRGGHDGESYQATQWYPKPAVYDKDGWHPMPYLDQGEFYSEFGNFDVRITVPENYVVAATGQLQTTAEKEWLKSRKDYTWTPVKKKIKKAGATKIVTQKFPSSAVNIKTLRYTQTNVHDFAWFADKRFIVQQDTCQLASGKTITVSSFYTPAHTQEWKNSLSFAKDAVRTRSNWIGEYPFETLSVVQGPESFGGGMEYPTITVLSPIKDQTSLDITIAHEIGHNWFYGILGTNERKFPWMDEGLNSFYDNRYLQLKYGAKNNSHNNALANAEIEKIHFATLAAEKLDQPIITSSEEFNAANYGLVAYYKAAAWLQYLETAIGQITFDKAIQLYYQRWQFKHPTPENFKQAMEDASKQNLDSIFSLLNSTGKLPSPKQKKDIQLSLPFSPKAKQYLANSGDKNIILVSPLLAANSYDKLMIGAAFTNYKLPPSKFKFIAAPFYATGSKSITGVANVNYSIFPKSRFQKIELSVGALSCSKNASKDSFQNKVFERFFRLTPSAKFYLPTSPRATYDRVIELKSFIIDEKNFDGFAVSTADGKNYVTRQKNESYYINQLSFSENNYRVLYPYNYNFQLQQGKGFYRLNFTGNYFFNYAKGGGMNVRLFAGKFGYLGNKSNYQFSTARYQPKLLGVTGEEDYTYSNYFTGRTASFANDPEAVVKNRSLGAQQIMMRDGAFKLRLDQYDFLQGRSDNWVAAINLNTSLPKNILPFELPVKLFADIGTFSQAWEKGSTTSRFLFVSGLQVSLFKDILNIYAPLLYSNEFRDNLKSLPDQNTFLKRLTFSIDIQSVDTRKITRALLF